MPTSIYAWRDLLADLWTSLKQHTPISAVLALISLAFLGLERLSGGTLHMFLLTMFVLAAVLAGGIGLIEVVAQNERWRLVAFLAMAYGLIAAIMTFAYAIAGMFPSAPVGP